MYKTIKFKNANLYFNDEGSGKTVVLLHGFLENNSFFQPLIKKLKTRFRVITPDIPGHGNSNSLGYLHSMELLADAIFHILKSNKIRKAQIIGHSMGGYIGLAFMEKYPDYLKSLTLLNSTAKDDSDQKKLDRDRAIALIKKNPSLFINTAIPSLFVPSQKKHIQLAIEKSLKMANTCDLKGIIASLEGMKMRSNREIVVRFSPCPVFYVIGKLDKTIPYQSLLDQVKNNENASYYLSEKGGHMCLYEDPTQTQMHLIEFLNQNK